MSASASPQSKAPRTVSIGGATFDLFVSCQHDIINTHNNVSAFTLPLGEKIAVERIIGACGGGASNTSVGLSRLGCTATFCGVVGDDQWGTNLLQNLKNEGVRTDCVTIIEEETSSFSLILNADNGERVILYDYGTNEHLHDVTFNRDVVMNMDWMYVNHLHERACVIQDDIITAITQENGPRMTWNPGRCQIDRGINNEESKQLLNHTTVLLVNNTEAMDFTKQSTPEDAMKAFVDAGVQYTFITLGADGAMATDGKQIYRCPNINTKAVDTTGAGDAFGTAITWAILAEEDLPTALRAGSINAASVVGSTGAQTGLLKETQLQTRLRNLDLPVDVDPL